MFENFNLLDLGESNWYAIHTNSRAEKKVYERILAIGLKAYLPLIYTVKVWSDRKKKVSVPLISSYVFVECKPTDLTKTLNLAGVANVLTFLGKPAIVRPNEIDSMRILLNDFEQVSNFDKNEILKGEKVEVISGPFTGLIAQAIDFQGTYRLIVELVTFNRLLSVNVPISFVRRLNK